MLGLLGILGLAVLAYVLVTPALLLLRVRRLTDKVKTLELQLDQLQEPGTSTPTTREISLAEAAEAAEDDREPPDIGADIADSAIPAETVAQAESEPEVVSETAAPSPWDRSAASARVPEDAPKQPRPARPSRSVEETLASRWMIWLGGLAVALSAVFLFSYAVEQGWLTPMTRVLLGLALGGLLLAGGEWTMRHPVRALERAIRTDFVPPALTASGIFAVFVSLYAAHALFGLLTPPTAFVALGLTAYAALALALRQGWFVAFLGMLAGYAVPALVEAPEAQAMPVFVYLFVLTAGCTALMIWRRWWWFAALTLAGSLLWPVLWMSERWTLADQGALGAYALGLAALFAGFSTTLPLRDRAEPALRWLWHLVRDTAGLGFTLAGVLLILLADAADYNDAAFLFPVGHALIGLAVAFWRPRLEGLVVLAALIGLAALALWPEPVTISPPEDVERLGTGTYATAFGPFVMPPEFRGFALGLWATALVFGLGGLLGLKRARTPSVWAAVSGAVPVLLLALAYDRIGAWEVSVQWAGLAAALSGAFVVAAGMARRILSPELRDLPLAFYAAAATGALALAFACVLREEWLSVAISLEVLALAWIWTRLPVAELRWLAVIVVGVVLTRLVLNPMVMEYEGATLGLFGWVIYGYGIPSASLLAASVLFARGGRDVVVILCEIAGIGLAFLMVALQLKLWTSGNLESFDLTLFDQSVQSVWWLTAAALLLHVRTQARYGWAWIAGTLVLLLAALQVFMGQVFVNSPLGRSIEVGGVPVFNLLGLAYLVPALQLLALGGLGMFRLPRDLSRLCRGAAGVLLFLYITLETRRAFQGSVIILTSITEPGNAEIYAYSAVWILFALLILAAGIRWHSISLRYASLAVLIVTVAKVFLYDMSDLTGLFKVASFLGLGLTLIGIGRVYQRFVFSRRASEGQDQLPPDIEGP